MGGQVDGLRGEEVRIFHGEGSGENKEGVVDRIEPQEKRIPVLTPCKAIVGGLRGESDVSPSCLPLSHSVPPSPVMDHQKGKEEE